MIIKAIGVGSARSTVNFQQCYMLEENGKKLLIDYGRQIPEALRYHGISEKEIDAVYISHKHNDHIGGLEDLAIATYDWINKPKNYKESKKKYAPKLYANETLMRELWDQSLRGGLETMEGFKANMDTFFETIPVEPNESFIWEGWKFSLVQQIHIMSGSIISSTFGLFVTKEGYQSVYFTTDSQHCSPRQMEIFYRQADIIIQDTEILPFLSGVHAGYVQLSAQKDSNSIDLGDEIRSKMYLSHYQDCVTQGVKNISKYSPFGFFKTKNDGTITEKDSETIKFDWDAQAKSDGFKGFMKLGDVIKLERKN